MEGAMRFTHWAELCTFLRFAGRLSVSGLSALGVTHTQGLWTGLQRCLEIKCSTAQSALKMSKHSHTILCPGVSLGL